MLAEFLIFCFVKYLLCKQPLITEGVKPRLHFLNSLNFFRKLLEIFETKACEAVHELSRLGTKA